MALTIFTILVFLSMAVQPVKASIGFDMPTPNATNSSFVIIDLPPGATQLRVGAEIYRLVCSPCHAYDGTGLTDQWRSTWDVKDQNCWQSKCHAENHPEEGFILPMSPPVIGPALPARFKTARQLYDFIHTSMPWYNPNSLTEEKAWAVTAYVMKLNGMAPPDNLNAQTAEQISIYSTVTIDPALKLSIPPGIQKNFSAATQPDNPKTVITPVSHLQNLQTRDFQQILIIILVLLLIVIILAVRLLAKK